MNNSWVTAQTIATICSSIFSLASVIIAVWALIQNSNVIKDTNKSYIVIYTDFIQVENMRNRFLILKNYGKSVAIIDSILYSNTSSLKNNMIPFKDLSNCSIGPNQNYMSKISFIEPYIPFAITIKYHDNLGTYENTFSFNTETLANQIAGFISTNSQTNLEKTISHTAQEILRKSL